MAYVGPSRKQDYRVWFVLREKTLRRLADGEVLAHIQLCGISNARTYHNQSDDKSDVFKTSVPGNCTFFSSFANFTYSLF